MISDRQAIEILTLVTENGGRVVIEGRSARFDGEDKPRWGFVVEGGDLGGGWSPTLREALNRWAESLDKLSAIDPDHYHQFTGLLALTSEDA